MVDLQALPLCESIRFPAQRAQASGSSEDLTQWKEPSESNSRSDWSATQLLPD